MGQKLHVRSIKSSGARRGKDVAVVARMHRAASVLADGRGLAHYHCSAHAPCCKQLAAHAGCCRIAAGGRRTHTSGWRVVTGEMADRRLLREQT